MALRRLAEHQPESFAFSAENAAWCAEQTKNIRRAVRPAR